MDTVAGAFLRLARAQPRRVFATLLFAGEAPRAISYGDLLDNAGRFARYYASAGIQRGQVVILILPHGAELLYAFVGALLHGAIPSIFAFPSIKTSPAEYRRVLEQLLAVCATPFLVAEKGFGAGLPGGAPLSGLTLLDAAGYRAFPAGPDADLEDAPERVVVLQHSSGTTGLKKGVALSNHAVMAQARDYAAALKLSPEDRVVSWLPLYHDMGLIAAFILPLVTGTPVVMMSPFEWVADPAMLLRAIREHRGTLCWLPNFAYNFLAARVEEEDAAAADLSSMRAFINCSEPVSARSHALFLERFGPRGVKPGMLATCYAMAETVFAVTQSVLGVPPAETELDGRRVVSSGRLIAGVEARVVDAEGRPLPERAAGEIVVRGESMLSGYYRRPDLTATALRGGWYHTGDLGFLSGGELFVTGRLKDLIIVAGKNLYPQDLEEVVCSVPGVIPGRAAAFGVYDEELGTEGVVVLAETALTDEAARRALKLAVARAIREGLECVANDIVLLPHMRLLKSSSGKISRAGNRERYLKERKNGPGTP